MNCKGGSWHHSVSHALPLLSQVTIGLLHIALLLSLLWRVLTALFSSLQAGHVSRQLKLRKQEYSECK